MTVAGSRANHAKAIYAALGIEIREIDQGQAWQNDIETHFNVMRRMADHHYAKAASWAALQAIWVHGAWCDSADLDRLFRLQATRVLDAAGSVRFRHWRLYGERGLAGTRAAAWLDEETLTVEYATDTVAQYRVAYDPDRRRLREVDEPRLFATDHASSQPVLPELAAVDWRPVQRLAPYRSRRQRREGGHQARLAVPEPDAATG